MMSSGKISFETVREIGCRFAHVEEAAMYGKPALKVKGKMFVCMASHRSAEPESLVVRVDFEQRADLLAADPNVYYITDHYMNYSSVLVRLARVSPDVLRDLLSMAYRFVVSETTRSSKAKKG